MEKEKGEHYVGSSGWQQMTCFMAEVTYIGPRWNQSNKDTSWESSLMEAGDSLAKRSKNWVVTDTESTKLNMSRIKETPRGLNSQEIPEIWPLRWSRDQCTSWIAGNFILAGQRNTSRSTRSCIYPTTNDASTNNPELARGKQLGQRSSKRDGVRNLDSADPDWETADWGGNGRVLGKFTWRVPWRRDKRLLGRTRRCLDSSSCTRSANVIPSWCCSWRSFAAFFIIKKINENDLRWGDFGGHLEQESWFSSTGRSILERVHGVLQEEGGWEREHQRNLPPGLSSQQPRRTHLLRLWQLDGDGSFTAADIDHVLEILLVETLYSKYTFSWSPSYDSRCW